MNYKKWTDDEEQELRESWNLLSTDAIAVDLGRNYQSVYMKARGMKLGRNKANKVQRWTKEEENYLDSSWGEVSKNTIAKNVGRTVGSLGM